MSRMKNLLDKLAKRRNALGTTIVNIPWSGLAQKVAAFPFDFVVFDLEHGTLTAESIEESLRICRLTDLPSIVRVPDSIANYISKTLDMGADGIMLPRVERMEQVETAIRAMRYYPRGRKGCGGFSNFRADDNGTVDGYNENRMLFIQIESQEGLDALPAILDKHGKDISGVLLGPYDTSIMIGTPLDICSDAMTKFIKDLFDLCKEKGVSCGSFVDDATMLDRYRSLGGNLFWTGTDLSLLAEAYKNLCNAFAEMNKQA